MARNPSIAETSNEAAEFDHILEKLERILVSPDSETEVSLRTSILERRKVAANLNHARELLTQLEQETNAIRITSRQQEKQADLIRKRELLKSLAERLRELNELGSHINEEDESSGEEDLIGEDTPDDETEEDQELTPPPTASVTDFARSPIEQPSVSAPYIEPDIPTTSTLRNRRDPRAELFGDTPATSTGLSTSAQETLMTHNRTEQESLTAEMLKMAEELKQRTRAFQADLEDEKDVLDRAGKGLDRNQLGMEAAQRRMGFLRRTTEGQGWFGRMKMYAYIFALAVSAILLVFVLPKFRF